MPDRRLKRILLVEDDPDIQEIASLALVVLGGYSVQVCATARDALDHAPFFRPDLILMDVMMPGTDGPGALKALREIDATARTPVVFMTAKVRRQEIARYDEPGCLGVIAKSFDPTFLPGTLERMWGRYMERLTAIDGKEYEVLYRAYMEELTEKVGAMQTAASALVRGGWDRPTLESLYHQAQRMADSSGVYGLAALSRAADILEDMVKSLLEDPIWPPAGSPGAVVTVVKAVKQAARSDALARQGRGSA